MTQKIELLNQIKELCKSVFDDPTLEINLESNAETIRGWDSMSNLIFINELENLFNVKFSIDEIYESNCIGDLLDAIIEKAK